MSEKRNVPKRIALTVLNSLKGGVVPRIGLPYITVGRKNEIAALLHDVDIISEGGASFVSLLANMVLARASSSRHCATTSWTKVLLW